MLNFTNFKTPDFSFVKKRWFLITIGSALGLLLIGFIWMMSVRGDMLNKAVIKVQKKLKEDYQLNFEVNKYEFAGLTTVDFQKVKLYPDTGEQLASIDQFKVSVKLFPLLSGNVQLDELDLKNANITLVKHDSTSNYDFLFRSKKTQDTSETNTDARTLAERVDNLLKKAFQAVPNNLNLENVSLSYQDSSSTQVVNVPVGVINNGDYDIDVYLNKQDGKWNFKGNINPRRQELKVVISSENKQTQIPFISSRFGLKVSFDELSFHLDEVARKGKETLEVKGGWSTKNLRINHHRLSDDTITLPEGLAVGGFLVSENTIELIKGTKVAVKDFSFEPKLKFSRKPKKLLELAVHTGKFKAQDFFDAIPAGLFENLEGVQVEGDVQYDMDFKVDLDDPDGLSFASKIDDKNLKVKKWGKADIAALNGPFVYEAYEDTVKMREIKLDPSNPNFTPLNQIAPILKKTVMNTEDPFFYKHKGFELEAFQLSIVTNIKEKKFKRGASTMSMQLIKNLYLNRNKTMMRKFEEILLVWLMEQSQEVSKDRLLEIYLNIIEWGKNVYGITEASKYYFGKTPNEITIGESLFLSSIIPRPKTGLSSFEYTGYLKPWVMKHFNTYGYIMNKLNQLEGEEVPANYGFYQVQLVPNLRPPKPKGIPDSVLTHDNIKDMVEEIDREEKIRKTLLEKLFGKSEPEEN